MRPGEPDATGRHPATQQLAHWFDCSHLPDYLQPVSFPFAGIAQTMIDALQDGPELTAGLRKLLEAKDCFVRQALADRREPG